MTDPSGVIRAEGGFGIYLHWPYCTRICPYCDFNVYKAKQNADLLPDLLTDLSGWRNLTGSRDVTSLHFGGGTPSLMPPQTVADLIHHVKALWGGPAEIAIEANPGDWDTARWHAYAEAGVTRLSLGVQSFHDPALKLLGRDHDAARAEAALDMALGIFSSVSMDLIFGWAGQTLAQLDRDLDIALASGVPHISTYQLTIEDGTAFAKAEARGKIRAVDNDVSADMYDHVRARLMQAGYGHYEISNFAKSGHESRHNLVYWRGGDYVGVGPGAHGRLTKGGARLATVAALRPEDYHAAIKQKGTGIAEQDSLSPQAWAAEYILMGLRIREGINLARYREIAGEDLNPAQVSALAGQGWLESGDGRLRASEAGRPLLNTLTERLLT